jgi:hypothetical protein
VLALALDRMISRSAGAAAPAQSVPVSRQQPAGGSATPESKTRPSAPPVRDVIDDYVHDARSALFILTEVTHAMAELPCGADKAEFRGLARVIRERTADLDEQCNMLVTCGQLANGDVRLQNEKASIRQILRDVAGYAHRSVRRRGGKLDFKLSRGLPCIVCDIDFIHTALCCVITTILAGIGHGYTIRVRTGAVRSNDRRWVRLTITAIPSCNGGADQAQTNASISTQLVDYTKYRLAESLIGLCGGTITVKARSTSIVTTICLPTAE